ncbi:MAG: hypothetical protein ABIT71_16665 [Vicinamibacteraceae bacterium]
MDLPCDNPRVMLEATASDLLARAAQWREQFRRHGSAPAAVDALIRRLRGVDSMLNADASTMGRLEVRRLLETAAAELSHFERRNDAGTHSPEGVWR